MYTPMTPLPTGFALPRRLLALLPWLILALGLGVTDMLRHSARQDTAQILEAEFQSWVNKITYRIESRLNSYVQVLRGVAGLFNASETVTRQEFHRYVADLRLEESYPGIQGIGFAQFIRPDQKAAHEAAIRQEGFPDYAIRPEGEREFYTSVIYLEPFTGRNLRAFGYDMVTEPVRWAAAVRARDVGQPTLSGKVTLQQETATDIQPGFLLFVPVYRADAPQDSLEERRTHLIGWAFSPLRMYDLMHSLLQTVEFEQLGSALNLEIYDGVHLSPDARLFTLHSAATTSDPAFQAVRRLAFGGHPWSLRVTSTPPFDARQSNEKAWLITIAGIVGSLLLALLVGVLTASQMRIAAALREAAQNIAERQRVEDALRESETRFRSYFELPLIGIAITSVEKGWLEINDRLCEMLGYSREALWQKTWAELTHPDDLAADVARFNEVLAAKTPGYSLEKRFIRADHRVLSTELSAAGVRDDAGQLRYFVALVQDITERKQAETNLRLALHRLDTLLASLYAGVLLVSHDGRVEFANQAFCDLFDLTESPDQLRGLTAGEMLQKIQNVYASPAESLARIQTIVADGQPVRGEELAMRGNRLYVRDFIPIILDGQPYGRLWHHVDITERRRAEDALRLSLAEIQRHDAQMMALNRMNDLLLSCETSEEAYAVITHSAEQLFASYRGGLAICRQDVSELDRVVSWGWVCTLQQTFRLDDCWALRRGGPHEFADPVRDLRCQRYGGGPEDAYLCVPLMAQNQMLGLLQVSTDGRPPDPAFREMKTLALTVSKSIKLALSNLRLREALREQASRNLPTDH